MKAKEIIFLWLENRVRSKRDVFYSFDFESEISNYGRLAHQKMYTPSTYSRAFRDIRSSDFLARRGYNMETLKHESNKSKGWKIKKA